MAEDTKTPAPPTTSANDPVQEALSHLKGSMPQSPLLSQMVGPAPAAGQPAAYVPPTYASRTASRELIHDRAIGVVVAIGPGEGDDSEFHAGVAGSISKSSVTGLASSLSHIARTSAEAAVASRASVSRTM